MNNLTRDQQHFLDMLTGKMRGQDNRATAFPLYYVYEKDEISVGQDSDCDRVALRNEDWREVDELTDNDGNVWKQVAPDSEMWKNEELGELTAFELQDSYAREYTIDYLRRVDKPIVNVGPFLTEEGAQAHINANHYHYNEPYIFVNSCWRNHELQEVLKILFTLTGKEIPSWYK